MDSEKHAALAGMFGVTGYPTLKWLPKGKTLPADAEDVKAPRTADGLGDFIEEKTGIKPRKAPQVPSVYRVIESVAVANDLGAGAGRRRGGVGSICRCCW